MPYRENLHGLRNPTDREQVLAVFGFGGLADLATVLPATPACPAAKESEESARKGRRPAYPPLLQYAVAVCARIYKSQRSAIQHLSRDGLWLEAIERYAAVTGIEQRLPLTPPTQDQQDHFVRLLGQDPDLLQALSERFTVSAIGQAKALGNFPEGSTPDYTAPDLRHAVFGDGTFYSTYSKVQQKVDKTTGEVTFRGSRATTGQPRVQETVTKARLDGKSVRGVNHVSVLTCTDAGWVVLANAQALGAEVKAARDLIDRLHHHLGERLHTVVWDRALTGWHLEDLMARQRILGVTKSVAAQAAKDPAPAVADPPATETATKTVHTAKERRAIQTYLAGAPLPLGTSVYPTNRGHEVVHSKHYRYGPPLGLECSHDLWVDDGALVDVRHDKKSGPLKVAHATALSAVPHPGGFGWCVEITWSLPCAENGEPHVFTITWRPRQGGPSKSQKQTVLAMRELMIVPRLDARFQDVYGQRNNTESYNSWVKSRLGNTAGQARAMRLSVEAQMLDHLCAGTLANALTEWRAFMLAGRRR